MIYLLENTKGVNRSSNIRSTGMPIILLLASIQSAIMYLGPQNIDTILMHWMSVKSADNKIREHSWPCLFHIR